MSNYFDIYCRTCQVKGNVFHTNWGDETIARIAKRLDLVAAMATAYHAVRDITGTHIEERRQYEDATTITDDLLRFAIDHVGHDVAARSEYGNFHDRCSDRYRCPGCDASHSCQRPLGHEGEHGRATT